MRHQKSRQKRPLRFVVAGAAIVVWPQALSPPSATTNRLPPLGRFPCISRMRRSRISGCIRRRRRTRTRG